mgnify:CR=1 FL=1
MERLVLPAVAGVLWGAAQVIANWNGFNPMQAISSGVCIGVAIFVALVYMGYDSE